MPAKGITIISELWNSLHAKAEKLLVVWMVKGDTLTQTIIYEKTGTIHGNLLYQTPCTEASRGWFENFKKRTCIQTWRSSKFRCESSCGLYRNLFRTDRCQWIQPQQVFNCEKAEPFWKMPNRTYITHFLAILNFISHQPISPRDLKF